jgi:hypothetical protein
VKFCSLSTQFLPPCPLAKPSYLMSVYGATILTIAIMQNESLRSFLGARSIAQPWKAVLPHLPDALANHLRTRERDRLALAPLTGASREICGSHRKHRPLRVRGEMLRAR